MARKLEVTNQTQGPKGFPEVGSAKPTIIPRGETAVLVVNGGTADLIMRAQEQFGERFTVVDHGEVEDDREGGAHWSTVQGKPEALTGKDGADAADKSAPAADGPKEGEYAPSLDFEALDEDQLRAYLKSKEVAFHPATGKPKLVAKALEADRAEWDEAQAEGKGSTGNEAI